MKQNILIIAFSLLVIVGIYMLFAMKGSKDSFDITSTPVTQPPSNNYDQHEQVCSQRVNGNGLIMSDNGMDIGKFIQEYDLSKIRPAMIPVTYCSHMYDNYNDYFSKRWESLSLCEQDNSEYLKEVSLESYEANETY